MRRNPVITSKIMSSIKSQDTEAELMLRKSLWKRGMRYRKNYKRLPGKPDIVFTKVKIAVFCDGDFWHGNNWRIRGIESLEKEISGYSEFWGKKILNNIKHDQNINDRLEKDGWIVMRFWESDIKANVEKCADAIMTQYYKHQR